MTTLTIDAAVRAAVDGVPDPELPPMTVGALGMVHAVEVSARGEVTVELLPTFAGCPATDLIAADVRAAVGAIDGVSSVTVRFRFDPPWTADRISGEGREALRGFGIAPPGARILPLTVTRPTACPYCGSHETERDSAFGPTPCRALHYCRSCRQPFEAFKDL